MDAKTLAAYDRDAAAFAADWHEQPAPTDLQALVRTYFEPGETADIGCGSGREVAWLCANGFPAVGYDPSAGLIAEARRRYPALRFAAAALPDLVGVAAGSFTNVLCETVIMHLDAALVGAAVRKLAALLRPDGTLYLSWRVTPEPDRRDAHGRLYAAFDRALVCAALPDCDLLLDAGVTSVSSGKSIHRVVARKR
jgi:SAM-dependent methyltransferase